MVSQVIPSIFDSVGAGSRVVDGFFDAEDNIRVSDNETMESLNNSQDLESVSGETSTILKNPSKEIPLVKIEEETNVSGDTSERPNAMDFTADVTFDQLNDEEVMEHFREIENVSFDPDSCGLESEDTDVDRSLLQSSQQSNDQSNKSFGESQDVIIVDESNVEIEESRVDPENQWYDDLIKTKVATVVERFSKLARVLKYSYPCYKNCLDRIEARIGTPVCKLDPPHRCPLDRAKINRWKFVCTRKSVMESTDSKPGADKNVENMWQLEPCDGSNTITNFSPQMIPTFVMRAVKMFEDFINSTNQAAYSQVEVKDEMGDDDVVVLESDEKLLGSNGSSGDKSQSDSSPQWLWLLVRSNNKGELMMFATGKCIAHNVMDSLKQLFESGLGKDCNVKSLYCKVMTKTNDVQTSNTTFLVGAEALDETVGELKIQLAPKTNFWLSTTGAEELARTVEAFLEPADLGTVIDIGCGLGLIGLSIAHKCYQVIGIDSPSEVEEAEMTCELNKIKNAYFLMGEPAEMMTTIEKAVEWRRAYAVVNANTNIGRTVEVMKGLRKIKNLRRVVLVTTLTKQSVRSILELTRPADAVLGDPFVATRAAVVDTLPIGPQFEVVILMERRPLPQMLNAVLSQVSPSLVIQNQPNKGSRSSPKKKVTSLRLPKILNKKSNLVKNTVALANKREATVIMKSPARVEKPATENNESGKKKKRRTLQRKKFVKNPFYEQPFRVMNMEKDMNQRKLLSPTKSQNRMNQNKISVGKPQNNLNQRNSPSIPTQYVNSRSPRSNVSNLTFRMNNEMSIGSSRSLQDLQKRKHGWDNDIIPDLMQKKLRENVDYESPKKPSQLELNLLQKVKEQQRLLEVAKQKLSGGPSRGVDHYTAKEVQDMLNLAIERTNQIESQIPHSAWDRVAPPGHASPDIIIQKEIMCKGRHVQEINQEEIVITTSNSEFKQTFDASWVYNRCSGVAPLEPNLVLPRDTYTDVTLDFKNRQVKHQGDFSKHNEVRWVPPLCTRRSMTPLTHSPSSTSKKVLTPLISDFKQQQPKPQQEQQRPPIPFQDIARPSRQFAPPPRSLSPLHQKNAPPPRELMHRRTSPPGRQVASVGFGDQWDIPSRGASEQQTNWQRAIDNNQANSSTSRWSTEAQPDYCRQGNNFNSSLNEKKVTDDNWTNNNDGSNAFNRRPVFTNQTGHRQWQQPQQQTSTDNRFSGPKDYGWNARGRDMSNTSNVRDIALTSSNKRRWSEPQSNENSWDRSADGGDWNDLPEDARDPWGDDTNSCGALSGNWNRNSRPNERTTNKDSWRNSGPPTINPRQQLQTNMNYHNFNKDNANPNVNRANLNMNNARWSSAEVRGDLTQKSQQAMNWHQGSVNNNSSSSNGWRQQNPFGGFQQQRPYN